MTWRAWAIFTALCVIWGTPYFFIKLALVDLAPPVIAWGRIAVGTAVLLPLAWHRDLIRPVLAHKRAICAFALVELVVPFVAIAMGERWINSSLAGILIATVPLTVIVLSPLFGIQQRLSGKRIAGLAVGFTGVVTLLGIDSISGTLQWLGAGCMLIATIGYATGPLIVQRYLSDVDELGAIAVSLGVGMIMLLPFAILSAPAHLPSVQSLTSIVILGVVCTALAMSMYFYLIVAAGASRASVVAYINPAVAAILGVFVLHEHFGIGALLGLLLILFGSWLATGGAKNQAHAA
ncbi:MAG TPA: EamA family transporter [Steroidobacteraceae bacterium]